jgi:hypothetical protein|tara:strand:- start:1130 stop:1534 length:405 start_codon:yes stop_codon:yes gene_type:complete
MRYFEKVDIEIIHNKVLTANEKMVYIICNSFRNAPKGCRVSYQYIKERTGIKDSRTITKILDRLTLFGLLARKQINKKTLHIVFDKPTMQDYILDNINMRNAQKKSYAKRKNKTVDKSKIIRLNDYLVVSKNAK